jgi:hypothetical protein
MAVLLWPRNRRLMKRTLPAQLAASALVLTLPCCVRARSKKEYKTKDGSRVVILPIGKPSGHDDSEGRVEFYSPHSQMLCALDYSSDDGEHGFGVVKAAWTPDNNYFVFSLTSSGGHQPWHTPTLFFSVRDNSIHSLDSYVKAPGISKGEFTLQHPNIVLTEASQGQRSAPVRLRLDSLPRVDKQSEHVLRCTDGAVIKPEPGSQKPDA